MNPVLPLQRKVRIRSSAKQRWSYFGQYPLREIPKTTYKKLFQGSYNRTKKYIPKKTRAKTLKNYK